MEDRLANANFYIVNYGIGKFITKSYDFSILRDLYGKYIDNFDYEYDQDDIPHATPKTFYSWLEFYKNIDFEKRWIHHFYDNYIHNLDKTPYNTGPESFTKKGFARKLDFNDWLDLFMFVRLR